LQKVVSILLQLQSATWIRHPSHTTLCVSELLSRWGVQTDSYIYQLCRDRSRRRKK